MTHNALLDSHDIRAASLNPLPPVKEKSRIGWGRILTFVILLWVVVSLIVGAATNERLDWGAVLAYLFDPRILQGLQTTLVLTAVSMAIATVLGVILALMALTKDPAPRAFARTYITIFRSVPPMVQLLFWYFLAAILPTITIGIPFGPDLVTFDTNLLITQFAAALLGLSLGEAAFLAEYIRGGILSVPRGQSEAAAACGLTPVKTFFRVVFPQAIRVILPAYGNSLISQVKNTAMVFVIGAGDLMTEAQLIYSQNFQQIPLLIVVSIWYLVIVIILTQIQRHIESRYSRGYTRRVERRPRARASRQSMDRAHNEGGTS
ncbi:amino acid ABC transporter permease [Paramicrobacterium fandaimingii]|uniref:amino acid ABC transporter permease n=1 Tax=Paramicrobacterium fandaimingii TaxID=2708079 RepID=UPI00142394A8|nr:amino acid ABC transporter permease [Microbacterium fandaimingii]